MDREVSSFSHAHPLPFLSTPQVGSGVWSGWEGGLEVEGDRGLEAILTRHGFARPLGTLSPSRSSRCCVRSSCASSQKPGTRPSLPPSRKPPTVADLDKGAKEAACLDAWSGNSGKQEVKAPCPKPP